MFYLHSHWFISIGTTDFTLKCQTLIHPRYLWVDLHCDSNPESQMGETAPLAACQCGMYRKTSFKLQSRARTIRISTHNPSFGTKTFSCLFPLSVLHRISITHAIFRVTVQQKPHLADCRGALTSVYLQWNLHKMSDTALTIGKFQQSNTCLKVWTKDNLCLWRRRKQSFMDACFSFWFVFWLREQNWAFVGP